MVVHYLPRLAQVNGRFWIMLLRFLCAGGAAVAVSHLSRRYYEEWFLQLKNQLPQSRTSIAGSGTSNEQAGSALAS